MRLFQSIRRHQVQYIATDMLTVSLTSTPRHPRLAGTYERIATRKLDVELRRTHVQICAVNLLVCGQLSQHIAAAFATMFTAATKVPTYSRLHADAAPTSSLAIDNDSSREASPSTSRAAPQPLLPRGTTTEASDTASGQEAELSADASNESTTEEAVVDDCLGDGRSGLGRRGGGSAGCSDAASAAGSGTVSGSDGNSDAAQATGSSAVSDSDVDNDGDDSGVLSGSGSSDESSDADDSGTLTGSGSGKGGSGGSGSGSGAEDAEDGDRGWHFDFKKGKFKKGKAPKSRR